MHSNSNIARKSISFFDICFLSFSKYNIHYLFHNRLLLFFSKFFPYLDSKFIRVHMGKLFLSDTNESLFVCSVRSASKSIKSLRSFLFASTKNSYLRIVVDMNFTHVWQDLICDDLVNYYSNSASYPSSWINSIHKVRIRIFFCFVFNNLLFLLYRCYLLFLILFHYLFSKSNSTQFISKYCVDLFFLGEEQSFIDNTGLRDQFSLCNNVASGRSFAVINPLNSQLCIYTGTDLINIQLDKHLSLFLSFRLIYQSLPSIKDFLHLPFFVSPRCINALHVRTPLFLQSFNYIDPLELVHDSFSYSCASFILASQIMRRPSFVYQYSLLGQINPMMHSPLSGIYFFTDTHHLAYTNYSKSIPHSILSSRRIPYPLQCNPSSFDLSSHLSSDQLKILDDSRLVLAYFDENYCWDKPGINSAGTFFFDDYLTELIQVLDFVENNVDVVLILKSQFLKNNFLSLCSRSMLLSRYARNKRIIDLCVGDHRNLVTAYNIGSIADVCIGSSIGGTACYEASLAGCRSVLIKSRINQYDNILPDNIIYPSFDEISNFLMNFISDKDSLNSSSFGNWSNVIL